MKRSFKTKLIFFLLFIFYFLIPGDVFSQKQNFNQEEYLKIYSKAVLVGIETPASSGSGVIIGKKNNQYLFITVKHVAFGQPNKNEEYWFILF